MAIKRTCAKCGDSFKSTNELIMHQIRVHNVKFSPARLKQMHFHSKYHNPEMLKTLSEVLKEVDELDIGIYKRNCIKTLVNLYWRKGVSYNLLELVKLSRDDIISLSYKERTRIQDLRKK